MNWGYSQSRQTLSRIPATLHLHCTTSLSNLTTGLKPYWLVAVILPRLSSTYRVRSYWSACWQSSASSSEDVRECDSVSTQPGDTMDKQCSYLMVFMKVAREQLSCQEVSPLKLQFCLWPLAWWSTMWWHVRRQQLPSHGWYYTYWNVTKYILPPF